MPIIDPELCTGCERCVQACPEQVLIQVEGKARLVRPQGCTYCRTCEEVCPEGAIALRYVILIRHTPNPGGEK